MKQLKNSLGFDIGTSKTRIFKGGKLIVETPTQFEYEGEILQNLIVNGKISDFNATEQFLRQEIKKVQNPLFSLFSPALTTIVSVPSDMNEVALRAFRDSFEHAGVKNCYMLFDCLIAAIGLGIDIKNSTSMIVDFGAGKTSITTTQGYKIIKNNILDISGNSLNETIQTYISRKYNLTISKEEAEKLKIEYVDLRRNGAIEKTVRVTGNEKKSKELKEILIESKELADCLALETDLLVDKILGHFEKLDESDSEKIRTNGIYLIGGGLKLKGLIDKISDKINVSDKSYNLDKKYMNIGFEKVQSNPEILYKSMII
ncbi:rod shape-determining protein [Maribellus maritimus]|uniref:rod shape-determining protein n=1 Tax=Maribellus maritimus TaxID=2870838 RepID=UPI001EEA1222|nr:rod shape-determining protein [Maribellus maritimus]MCG6191542.1 rod shape-determining protein [Maribellus maritimus]